MDQELPKGFLGWWDCTEEDFSIEDEWEAHYLHNCLRCPDRDLCVIAPEEFEDDCHFIRRGSNQKVSE